MFFSEYVLTKRGKLAKVWLAAHWDRKLTKSQIEKTNVASSSKEIISAKTPIALRTSGHLLLGVVKIYSRKVTYVVQDCHDALLRLKLQAATDPRVDLPDGRNRFASYSQITLSQASGLNLSTPLPTSALDPISSSLFGFGGTLGGGGIGGGIGGLPDIMVLDPEIGSLDMDLMFDDSVMIRRMGELLGPAMGAFQDANADADLGMLERWEVASTGSVGDFDDTPVKQRIGLMGMDEPDSEARHRGSMSATQPERELTRRTSMADEEGIPDADWPGVGDGRPSGAGLGAGDPDANVLARSFEELDGGGDEIRLEDLEGGQGQPGTDGVGDGVDAVSLMQMTGRKRKRNARAQWDDPISISRTAYKFQLHHTADIVRPRSKIRKTSTRRFGELSMWERLEAVSSSTQPSSGAASTSGGISDEVFTQLIHEVPVVGTLGRVPDIRAQWKRNVKRFFSGSKEGPEDEDVSAENQVMMDGRGDDDVDMIGDVGGGDEIRLEDLGDDLGDVLDARSQAERERQRRRLTGIDFEGDDIGSRATGQEPGVAFDFFSPATGLERMARNEMVVGLKKRGYAEPAVNFLSKLRVAYVPEGNENEQLGGTGTGMGRIAVDEEFEDESEEVSLNALIGDGDDHGRRAAAQAFAQVLALANKGMIRPRQEQPFGDIHIRRLPKFRSVVEETRAEGALVDEAMDID